MSGRLTFSLPIGFLAELLDRPDRLVWLHRGMEWLIHAGHLQGLDAWETHHVARTRGFLSGFATATVLAE